MMRNVATLLADLKRIRLHSLLLTTFILLPGLLQAQETGKGQETSAENSIMNKPVKLNLESADLYYAWKLLFSQAKADFTLDNSLKGTLITVKINQPFRVALESVIKASGLPITSQLENGVYSIIPIKEENTPLPTDLNTPEDEKALERSMPRRIRVNNVSGIDIVAMLGGRFAPWTGSGSFVGYIPSGVVWGAWEEADATNRCLFQF